MARSYWYCALCHRLNSLIPHIPTGFSVTQMNVLEVIVIWGFFWDHVSLSRLQHPNMLAAALKLVMTATLTYNPTTFAEDIPSPEG